MKLKGITPFGVEVKLSKEDCVLLADACRRAVRNYVMVSDEPVRVRLEDLKFGFEAAAVALCSQIVLPLSLTGQLGAELNDVGLLWSAGVDEMEVV